MFTIIRSGLPGLIVLKNQIFRDERGYFLETFSQRDFEKYEYLQDINFVQDNQSCSVYGVIRALHFQKGEYAQSKLVRVVKGHILDVAVDLRKDSPTFGKYFSIDLTEDNFTQLFIPKGFAHGFSVLSSQAIVQYKCDNFYNPEEQGGIIWNDKTLNIDWKLPEKEVILSQKDAQLPTFVDNDYFFDFIEK